MWIGELFVREKVPSKLPLSTTPENLPVDGFPAIETIAFTLQKRSSPTDGCCGAAAPFYFIFVNHKEKERERRFAVSFSSRRGGPGKALRCFLQLSERRTGKGASLFPSLGWEIYSRKTSHREVFLGCANRKFVKGAFLLQKPPLLQAENQLAKFTRKGASNAKVFRALRSSTKGFAFGNHKLLKKLDQNFYFWGRQLPLSSGEAHKNALRPISFFRRLGKIRPAPFLPLYFVIFLYL